MQRRHFSVIALAGLAGGARSEQLVDLIESASPSVVAVGTYDPLKSPRFNFRGTGFVVGDGKQVVTNAHVLPQASDPDAKDRLAVLLPRRGSTPEIRMATAAKQDAAHDLAMLGIDGQALAALLLSNDAAAPAGTSVALLGFPIGGALGFTPVAHRGIVAALTAVALPPPTARQLDEKTLSRLRQGAFEIYQLDATAYPGSSGSPLFDTASGKVIGIINMVYVKSTKESAVGQPTGITYAIPIRHAAELLTR